MASTWGIMQDKENIFSTAYDAKENLNSGNRRKKSIKHVPKNLQQVETRKALGNVGNVVSHKRNEASASMKESFSSLPKSKSHQQKAVNKNLASKLEQSVNIVCEEETWSDKEDMHNCTESEDDYEDIFPKHERLTKEECDWLKDWRPTFSNFNACLLYPDPGPKVVLEKWMPFEKLIPPPVEDSEMYDNQELILIPHLEDSV